MALSVWGDSYWKGGWMGLLLTGLAMGFAVGELEILVLKWIQSSEVELWPASALAILFAFEGPTRFIVNGLISPVILICAYVIGARFFLLCRTRVDEVHGMRQVTV